MYTCREVYKGVLMCVPDLCMRVRDLCELK